VLLLTIWFAIYFVVGAASIGLVWHMCNSNVSTFHDNVSNLSLAGIRVAQFEVRYAACHGPCIVALYAWWVNTGSGVPHAGGFFPEQEGSPSAMLRLPAATSMRLLRSRIARMRVVGCGLLVFAARLCGSWGCLFPSPRIHLSLSRSPWRTLPT
jgi:hypothetical protein